jgi:hypothetical protein
MFISQFIICNSIKINMLDWPSEYGMYYSQSPQLRRRWFPTPAKSVETEFPVQTTLKWGGCFDQEKSIHSYEKFTENVRSDEKRQFKEEALRLEL